MTKEQRTYNGERILSSIVVLRKLDKNMPKNKNKKKLDHHLTPYSKLKTD